MCFQNKKIFKKYDSDNTTSVGSFGVTLWLLPHPSISIALIRPIKPKQFCLLAKIKCSLTGLG